MVFLREFVGIWTDRYFRTFGEPGADSGVKGKSKRAQKIGENNEPTFCSWVVGVGGGFGAGVRSFLSFHPQETNNR